MKKGTPQQRNGPSMNGSCEYPPASAKAPQTLRHCQRDGRDSFWRGIKEFLLGSKLNTHLAGAALMQPKAAKVFIFNGDEVSICNRDTIQ